MQVAAPPSWTLRPRLPVAEGERGIGGAGGGGHGVKESAKHRSEIGKAEPGWARPRGGPWSEHAWGGPWRGAAGRGRPQECV